MYEGVKEKINVSWGKRGGGGGGGRGGGGINLGRMDGG